MTCNDLNQALVDLVDGRLDAAAQRSVDRHLEVCDNCRMRLTELRTIRGAADPAAKGRLPGQAGGGRRPGTGGANWPVWLGAAAALMLATLIGLLALTSREAGSGASAGAATAPAEAGASVESVTAEFEAAEKHYQKAIDDLQTIANQDPGELDPQLAVVLQKNLSVIDQAISESRAALKSQPASSNAQAGLFDALRTKVALLQQTVELINEMRKGNQAEAGRKFQTLSQ